MEMKTICVNLFGQPGAGKSTTSAGLFYKLKNYGVNCELVTEYAKDMVWRNMPKEAFLDQFYITAKQNHRLIRLDGKVDVMITDSPLPLGLIYNENYNKHKFENFILSVFNQYNNYNYFIKRVKPYNPIGRNQNEQESDVISTEILEMLNQNFINYQTVDGDEHIVDYIISDILDRNFLFNKKYGSKIDVRN